MSTTRVVPPGVEALHWVSSEKSKPHDKFTSDELINAYFSGKKMGRQELYDEVIKVVKDSTDSAKEILSRFYHQLTSDGIPPSMLALRRGDGLFFEGAFVIDSKTYTSDRMDSIIERTLEIEKEAKVKHNFELRILFIPLRLDIESTEENLVNFDWFYVDSAA